LLEKALKQEFTNNQRKQTKRPFVLAAVMLAMFMAAVEATIVSTAMPSIVSDLGGFSKYSWIFSAYLLMNAITVLIYGKLSDIFGRKPVLTVGIIIFLVGSILCGTSSSMEWLIFYRFIQGIGAGAVMPIASTIVGDIYSKEERAKIQGYLSSIWGVSAITGPVLGGLIVEFTTWRYVFWINVPIGIIALIGLHSFLHEQINKRSTKIDYHGAFLMFVSISSLMMILVEGGVRFEWTSFPIVGLGCLSLITFIMFIRQEQRAQNPMMPLEIWKHRSILIANVIGLTTGIILIGISSFLPAFVQGVMGKSPMVAGFTLMTMSIGWPIAATIAGRLILTLGYRKTSIFGGIFLIIGGLIFFFLSKDAGPLMAMAGSFFIGVGMGLSSTAFIVSIQSTVGWEQRGIATATNMFMRNVGSTIGAALLGGIINSRLAHYIEKNDLSDQVELNNTHALLDPHGGESLTAEAQNILREGLNLSLHHAYTAVLIFALISFFLILFFPKEGDQET